MASGSADYWVNKDNWLHSLLTSVEDVVTDYGQEDWDGTIYEITWTLISSVSTRRNMLRVNHVSGPVLHYSRDGSTDNGSIPSLGSVIFYDSPGVWLIALSGPGTPFTAHEEWAT